MALELLDVMGESVVARKSAEVIRRFFAQVDQGRGDVALLDSHSTIGQAVVRGEGDMAPSMPADVSLSANDSYIFTNTSAVDLLWV